MTDQLAWAIVRIDPIFGVSQVVACPLCAALVADADEHKAVHAAWHESAQSDGSGGA